MMLKVLARVARYPAAFRLSSSFPPRARSLAARSSAACGLSGDKSPATTQLPSRVRSRLISSYKSHAAASKHTASNSRLDRIRKRMVAGGELGQPPEQVDGQTPCRAKVQPRAPHLHSLTNYG